MAAGAGAIAARRLGHRVVERRRPQVLAVEEDRALLGERRGDGAELLLRPRWRFLRTDPGVTILLVIGDPFLVRLHVLVDRRVREMEGLFDALGVGHFTRVEELGGTMAKVP